MFVCKDCGAVFENYREYIEIHNLDTPPYEVFKGCPICAGAFAETYPCSICGDYITGVYIELTDGTLICENCYTEKNAIYD